MSLGQFLRILRARIWAILAVTALLAGAAAGISLVLAPQFTAETSVVVDARGGDPLQGATTQGLMVPGYMATQIDIINSDRVARRVVSLVKLDQSASVRDQWQEETGGRGDIRVWLANLLQRNLEVRPSRDSSVITIAFSGTDPQFAALVANGFAEAYVETNLELRVEPARQYARWFDERTGSLRADLEQAQSRLSAYQREYGIVAADERLDVESAKLQELSSQLLAVQAQRVDSRSRQAQTGAAETLPEVMQNGLIQSLKADLTRQEGMRDQLAARLGRNHPELASVRAEIDNLRTRIATEVQRVASSLGTTTRVNDQREVEIRAALDKQKARVLELKSHRDEISVLQRDVENAQRAYDLVTQRLAQTSLESENQQGNVAVLTPAVAPLDPSRPRLVLNVAVATCLGLLLGIGLALILELTDRRVRSASDLLDALDLPMLGTIPGKPGNAARLAA
ncbi:MAG: chain length determinant protein EpsF [Rhodocyclaceae bacterium]|nr:chain length determinant protein EpsF [Rhodocyclaceae bacterium]